MLVGEIMTRQVEAARPNDTLEQLAKRMAELDVGAVPVCEEDRVVGMVTDRDIVVRGMAEGRSPETAISEIMSTEVETVSENDDVESVHDRMSASQVRRLPVLNDDGRIVGIVALADVALRDQPSESGQTLEEISEPQ